jgi:hypothetical protein
MKYTPIEGSGVYLMKTDDSKSKRYDHKIVDARTQKGVKSSQFVITYENPNKEKSIVKVRLYEGDEQIEFDVFFVRIPSSSQSHDVTVNFKSLTIDPHEYFFTDSNGIGMVKRITDEKKIYESNSN